MNRFQLWLVVGINCVLGLAVYIGVMGGLEGIAQDPTLAAGVLGFLALATGLPLWLTLRRMKREPVFVPVDEPEAGAPLDARLEHAPLVVVGSRWKAAVGLMLTAGAGAPMLLMVLAQPGVCRVAGLTAYAPLLIGALGLVALRIAAPDHLTLGPAGLSHTRVWGTREWSWDEVGPVVVSKTALPLAPLRWVFGRQVTSGFHFKRVARAGDAPASSRVGFRPMWRIRTDDVASLVSAGRRRWARAGAIESAEVSMSWRDYLWLAVVLVIVGGILWMSWTAPCGGPRLGS